MGHAVHNMYVLVQARYPEYRLLYTKLLTRKHGKKMGELQAHERGLYYVPLYVCMYNVALMFAQCSLYVLLQQCSSSTYACVAVCSSSMVPGYAHYGGL
jgi:hypothetical protein